MKDFDLEISEIYRILQNESQIINRLQVARFEKCLNIRNFLITNQASEDKPVEGLIVNKIKVNHDFR